MADSKLSALPTGAAVADADLFYSDQSASSVKQPATALATYMAAKNPAAPPAVTYYISAVGSDSNNGTSPATPWQTITKVNSIAPNPGTTFLFRGGDTFSGTIAITKGGQPGLPITYSSYGGGTSQATISPGNNSAITCTDFGNITITNLILTGSGFSLNTGHGMFFQGVNVSCQNFLISGLTISQFGGCGIGFLVGSVSNPIFSNVTITQCTVHDCGQNGIYTATNNNPTPFQAYLNVLVDHCTVYNCNGANSLLKPEGFNGFGVKCQGVVGLIVQYCNVYQNARFAQFQGGGTGTAGSGIYAASDSNILIQFNEVWGQQNGGNNGHDGGGALLDFGVNNATVQYNYLHDNWTFGLGCGTLTISSIPQNNNNIVVRYNVIANNGAATNLYLANTYPIGVNLYTLSASESLTNFYFYNNTVVAKGGSVTGLPNYALFSTELGHSGTMSGIIANNIFYGDANTTLLNYYSQLFRFIGNAYIGGSSTAKINFNGGSYASVAAWIAATTPTSQETVDGASVLVTATDPVLTGSQPFVSPVAGGYVPGRAANFQLAANSPVAGAGLDLSTILPYQTSVPPFNSFTGIDFDFKGATYNGDVIGSISCTRTATSATDLLPTSPLGASFTTFAANTLRITAGKGLLVEEARTQFLATPGAPATQTTASLSTGTYILWVNGTGIATASNGTATIVAGGNGTQELIAVQGKPAMITVTVAGTIVVTVTGTLNQFQLENDPNGNGQATSFISAIGTRDADQVTTAAATTIGSLLQAYLNAGTGFSNPSSIQIFFNIPIGVQNPNVTRAALIEDSNSVSQFGLEAYTGGTLNPLQVTGVSTLGSVTTRLAHDASNDMVFNTRQAIGALTDPTNGQSLVLNGGPIATNASLVTPAVGSTIWIGSNPGKTQVLNGYIERITSSHAGNAFTAAQLQANTSLVPISGLIPTTIPNAGAITQDFYGNLVPNSSGVYSIGAHQPLTATDFYGSPASTVAGLPSATASLKGARRWVSDANATFTAGIGATVAGGGGNIVPVFCDGSNWRIG